MNEYNSTEVLDRNRKLFKNFSFKFKGLEDETLNFYIQCVKDLGAEVSNDATYTFAEYLYFKNNTNKEHTDLYDITYILHSVEEEKALEINLYRFTDENLPRWVNDFCSGLYKSTIKCEQNCSSENFCIQDECIENNYISSNVDNMLIDGDENNIENKNVQENAMEYSSESFKSVSLSRKSDVDNEGRSSSEESDVNNEEPQKKKQRKLKSHKINESQNKEVGTVNNNEYEKKIVKSMAYKITDFFTSYYNSKPNSDSVKNIKSESATVAISTSEENNKKSNSVANHIRKNKSKAQYDSSTYKFSSDEEQKDGITDQAQEDWWLPRLTDKQVCQIPFCSFIPEPHESYALPGHFLSELEKKKIIKYLIMTDSIHLAKGAKVWINMINAGFLKHRSHETLRNIIHRTILPNIKTFNLPPIRDRK